MFSREETFPMESRRALSPPISPQYAGRFHEKFCTEVVNDVSLDGDWAICRVLRTYNQVTNLGDASNRTFPAVIK